MYSSYCWGYNMVLKKLAMVLEHRQKEESSQSPLESRCRIHFYSQGKFTGQTSKMDMQPGKYMVVVDLGRQVNSPQKVCSITLRPDVVLWSAAVKSASLIELTVPWKEGLEASHQ